MVQKVNKEYLETDQTMFAYLAEVRKLEERFSRIVFKYIPQKYKYVIDALTLQDS